MSGRVIRDTIVQLLPKAVKPEHQEPVPHCRVAHSTTQSCANAALTVLTFNTVRWNLGAALLFSTATPTRVVTAPWDGLYAVGFVGLLDPAANSDSYATLRLNGATEIARGPKGAAVAGKLCNLAVATAYRLTKGQYLEVLIRNDTGAALNMTSFANMSPECWARWVSN